jgi:deazaflavin-dependent oxidoreductase (nitroreductase family)
VARKYRLTTARKVFNRFITILIRLGIPTGSTCLLLTTGRSTGQTRSTPVTVLVVNGRRWLVSPYGEVAWVQNVRAAGRVSLKSGSKMENVQLTPASRADTGPLLKSYVEKYRVVAPFFDAKPGDPVERFAAEADKHPVFAVNPA